MKSARRGPAGLVLNPTIANVTWRPPLVVKVWDEKAIGKVILSEHGVVLRNGQLPTGATFGVSVMLRVKVKEGVAAGTVRPSTIVKSTAVAAGAKIGLLKWRNVPISKSCPTRKLIGSPAFGVNPRPLCPWPVETPQRTWFSPPTVWKVPVAPAPIRLLQVPDALPRVSALAGEASQTTISPKKFAVVTMLSVFFNSFPCISITIYPPERIKRNGMVQCCETWELEPGA